MTSDGADWVVGWGGDNCFQVLRPVNPVELPILLNKTSFFTIGMENSCHLVTPALLDL